MLDGFHPAVAGWFTAKFGTPTEPQRLGWPRIQRGEDTLIAAPTGSGKTLAAFLACLDAMIREGTALRDETQVLYVSPLKALANDVRKNLIEPLAELRLLDGVPEIRTGVRTGDTPQSERQAMLKHPPHVLVTTPESFYLLLTSTGGRKMLATVRTVVVDEIHAVARDKRGAHLMLSLERLDALCGRRCVRIGLSATQRPIEEIGRFLTGGQPCAIVESGARRPLDVRIEVPREELCAVASREQREEIHDRIAQLCREHRTTLVFVNTRRQVERVAHALGQRLGEDQVVAHHGSLARPVRLLAEEKLKRGQVRCAVATASLELGLDVGAVDLVIQLESPRSFSVALQRIGRASHHRGGIPKGRLFPVTRDQLVECAALVRGMAAGNLEVTRIPDWPLDVLAQQLVAMAACEDIGEDAAYALSKRAWNYRNLPRRDFDQITEMHGEGVARRAGRAQGARLHRDGVNKILKARRGSRLAAITSGGAIPDTAQYAVVAEPEGVTIGQVDEDWAIESMAGDIFLLATRAGASAASRPGGCGSRTRTARRPRCPSGTARRRGAPRSCRKKCRGCARRSSRCWPTPRGRRRGSSTSAVCRRKARSRWSATSAPSRRRWARCRRSGRWWPSGSSTRPAGCSSSSMRPSAPGRTAPSAWRCASASAGPSTSSCRRRPPTRASSSRSARRTAFHSKPSSIFFHPEASTRC